MISRSIEAVFEAVVDYKDSKRSDADSSTATVRQLLKERLEKGLQKDLHDIYNIDAKIKVRSTQTGSLHIFFTAAISMASLVANYKSLFESLILISQHAKFLIECLLRTQQPNQVPIVDVFCRYPIMNGEVNGVRGAHASEWPLSHPRHFINRRDGLFWSLAIFSFVVFILLCALVWGAVHQTYFGVREPEPAQHTVVVVDHAVPNAKSATLRVVDIPTPDVAGDPTSYLATLINGKICAKVELTRGASDAEIIAAAIQCKAVQAMIDGRKVANAHFVEGRYLEISVR